VAAMVAVARRSGSCQSECQPASAGMRQQIQFGLHFGDTLELNVDRGAQRRHLPPLIVKSRLELLEVGRGWFCHFPIIVTAAPRDELYRFAHHRRELPGLSHPRQRLLLTQGLARTV